MKDDIFNLVPGSEETILHKNFNELSLSEKKQFLVYISPEEYELIRRSLLNIKSVFKMEEDMIISDESIKNNLLNALPDIRINSVRVYSPVIKFFTGKIPVYQSVLLLLIGIFFMLKFQRTDAIKYITQTIVDTVYTEKVHNINHVMNMQRINNEKPDKEKSVINSATGKKNIISFTNAFNQVDTQNVLVKQNLHILRCNINLVKNTKLGRSFNTEKDLYQVLVTSQ
jgi:hypothetical protein